MDRVDVAVEKRVCGKLYSAVGDGEGVQIASFEVSCYGVEDVVWKGCE
jgi:hypothetical protein